MVGMIFKTTIYIAVRNRGKHHSPRHDGMEGCPTFLTTRLFKTTFGHTVSDTRSRTHGLGHTVLDDFEDDFSDVRSRTHGVGRTVLYPLLCWAPWFYGRSKQGEAPLSTPRWHEGVPDIPYDTTLFHGRSWAPARLHMRCCWAPWVL